MEDVRFMSGYKMGQKDDSEVDCACGIPDSGVGMALGYAEGKGCLIIGLSLSIHRRGLVVLPRLTKRCVLWWLR